MTISRAALDLADSVAAFVRTVVFPYEADPRRDHHGAPLDEMVWEMREKARAAGVLTPHINPDGSHRTQRETAVILIKSGLSPLGTPPSEARTMATASSLPVISVPPAATVSSTRSSVNRAAQASHC